MPDCQKQKTVHNGLIRTNSRSRFGAVRVSFRVLGAVLGVVLCAALLHGQAQDPLTASIAGFLVDDRGHTLGGAQLNAVRVTGARLTTPFSSRTTSSDGAGFFTFKSLPQGLYRVCASIPGTDLLDPCEWSSRPPSVFLQAGKASTGLWVEMAHGKLVNIRIVDQGQSLKADSNGHNNHQAIVRLRSPGKFHPMPKSTEDSNGQSHTIAVPIEMDLQLDVTSPTLSVKGDGEASDVNVNEGKKNPDGTSSPSTFRLNKYDGHKEFRFTAQGSGK